MGFRRKLLILLLVIALVPLLINGLLHRSAMRRISQQLMTDTKDILQKDAVAQLQVLTNNQALLLKRDRAFFSQAINAQVREVESRLANRPLLTAAEMTEYYMAAQKANPDMYLWHATFLQSGHRSIFPKGILSDSKQAEWQQNIASHQDIGWQLSVENSQLQFQVFSPVRLVDGTLAGLTVFALDYQQLFNDWQLPPPWREQGRLFIASIDSGTDKISAELNVLLEVVAQGDQQASAIHANDYFQSAAPQASKEALIKATESNHSGALTLSFDNKESIWTYAAAENGEPFPLLLVPSELVSLPANQAAEYVEDQFLSSLQLTALLSFGVLLWVIITAIFRARAVTQPVAELADAAELLSQGDFSAQVNIRTNDEFEELGTAFNRIGPQLKERQEIKQSLAVAQDIQQLILPAETPLLENFEIGCRLDYCDETGGDYYDFIQTESNKLGLVVGDVVGHGIGAALLMASAAGILHAAIANGEENLEVLFASLNTFLEKDVGDTRFMTLFFALLNPVNHSLQWLSAGHGPMFLYRATSNEVEELTATTMPLGVMDDVEFTPIATETLASGDMLVVGTDGIWETSNAAGEMFGSERVCKLLKNFSKNSAEDIVSEVLLAVEKFRGQALQDDDLTLIILKAK